MTDRPDLTTAAVGAWATVARAWIEAADEIAVSWLDFAAAESGQTGFNEEVVVVEAQPAATDLRLGRFVDWDDNELPAAAVAVEPPRVPAGVETAVRVRVHSSGDLTSGTYTGALLKAHDGTPLVDEIGVYVVGGLGS
ncbi:MAG TPA: hypothetical protein VF085_02155 [Solirubrobacterales bacterium]